MSKTQNIFFVYHKSVFRVVPKAFPNSFTHINGCPLDPTYMPSGRPCGDVNGGPTGTCGNFYNRPNDKFFITNTRIMWSTSQQNALVRNGLPGNTYAGLNPGPLRTDDLFSTSVWLWPASVRCCERPEPFVVSKNPTNVVTWSPSGNDDMSMSGSIRPTVAVQTRTDTGVKSATTNSRFTVDKRVSVR